MRKLLLLVLLYLINTICYSQSPIAPSEFTWRLKPLDVIDDQNNAALKAALINGTDFTTATSINANSSRSITIKLPGLKNAGMLTYSFEGDISGIVVNTFTSTDGINWQSLVANSYTNGRGDDLQKADIPLSASSLWFKIVFQNTSGGVRNLKELGLYEFPVGAKAQYFLMVGASLTEPGGNHTLWKETIQQRVDPAAQPVIFNWAISGETSTGLKGRIDGFLSQHPYASYVLIETGGNDISAGRPLTFAKSAGSDLTTLENNIRYIVNAVIKAGKIPVLSRFSFRNYPNSTSWQGWAQPAVNGGLNQENGSLPYNFSIDKIIKELTPLFWNESEKRGYLDFYQYTLNNQSWLVQGDGVHFYGGQVHKIREFWADYAYKFIYKGVRGPVIPYTEFVPNLTVLATNAVIKAEQTKSKEDIWNARILVEQIASTATRLSLFSRLDNIGNAIVAPKIIQQPSALSLESGDTASFSVVVSGTAPFNYQWKKNGQNISGANTSTLTISSVTLADNNSLYSCVITNGAGTVTSLEALLNVRTNPRQENGLTARYYANSQIFTTNPTITRIDPTVNFSWGHTAPDPSVGTNWYLARWTGKVQPETSGLYTFYTLSDDGVRLWVNNQLIIDKWVDQADTEWSGTINLTAGQLYNIKLEYYEAAGGAICQLFWSNSSLPKQIIPNSQLFPESVSVTSPTISQQPSAVSIVEGGTAIFEVKVNGSNPLSYQWIKNGVNIPGANASILNLANVQVLDNNAKIKCIITNSAGSITTSEVILSVSSKVTAPTIMQQPSSVQISPGAAASFSVIATGTGILAYQWQKDGIDIPSATQSTLSLTNVQPSSNNSKYKCKVTNNGGTVVSLEAVLTVMNSTNINGLNATYFSNVYASFNAPVSLSRIDPNINFNWAYNAPHASVTADRFSVRWTGKIKPAFTEEYTFYTQSDDGARLWVNNVLIIDRWLYQGETEWSGKITLSANQLYNIKLEYFDGNGSATCRLLWGSTSTPKQIVPSANLFPDVNNREEDRNIGNVNSEKPFLYPTVTDDMLYIQIEEGVSTVRIVDLAGQEREVKIQMGEFGRAIVSTKTLSSGTYLLKSGTKSQLFIKQQ